MRTRLSGLSFGKGFLSATVMLAFSFSDSWGQCPEIVKKKPASLGNEKFLPSTDANKLPYNGWFVFADAESTFISPIKNFQKKKVLDANGKPFKNIFSSMSPDGSMALVRTPTDLALVRRDGTVAVKPLLGANGQPLSVAKVSFWYSSPKQKSANGVFEIAYVLSSNKKEVFSALVDLKSPTPKLYEERKIATGLSDVRGNSEFGAAGEFFMWENGNPTFIHTIPNGGMGVADATHLYKVSSSDNCSMRFGWDAKYFGGNHFGGGCVPTNHKGFVIQKPKRNTDALVNYNDYTTDTAKGALSVNWSPEYLPELGPSTWAMGNKSIEFWINAFGNHRDWLIANVSKNNGDNTAKTARIGALMLNWKTNEWTWITPTSFDASWMCFYFDGVPAGENLGLISYTVNLNYPSKKFNALPSSGLKGFDIWNIQGRKTLKTITVKDMAPTYFQNTRVSPIQK